MAGRRGDPIGEYIESYYDRQAEIEWSRMDRHPTEFAVTVRALTEFLPPPPAKVLDCGGGPGRYAIELTSRGYAVTLFDLSVENLRLAQEKAAQANVTLAREGRSDHTIVIDHHCSPSEQHEPVCHP